MHYNGAASLFFVNFVTVIINVKVWNTAIELLLWQILSFILSLFLIGLIRLTIILKLRSRKFVYIKFNDIYIHLAVFGAENIQRLEFILQHANHRPGCILRNQTDKLLVKPMIEAIIREYVNRNIYSSEIITQLINTIIIVVVRNIAMFLPEQMDENFYK